MPQMPQPKFAIGDTVYWGSITETTGYHPCPDCLGTRRWSVSTPAGSIFECACERCSARWTGGDFPSLAYRQRVPYVQQLTIGSVRIDTAERDGKTVSYMCNETGVGSGSIYYENLLHVTEADALAVATMEATKINDEVAQIPTRVEQARVSGLKLEGALFDKTWNAVWDAWYAYRSLVEFLQDAIKNGDDLVDAIQYELESRSGDHGKSVSQPLDEIVSAARAVVDGGPVSTLAAALALIPEHFYVKRDEPLTLTDSGQ